MKHYLLLALLFLSVACKNTNSTSTDPYARNMPFENSVYLTIPHQEDQSVLRRKLLNLSLNNQLKGTNEVDEASQIKKGDEFKFIDDKFQSSSLNLEEYMNLRSSAAEVIVSYKDRLEIYFVPSGIERKKAFAQLGVIAESEASFSWVGTADNFLLKRNVYYLVSATKVNLKENDVHFNQQRISLGDYFNERMFNFSSNQILELVINVDYSLRETSFAVLGGKTVTCKSDMREAGMCEPCNYKLETPTGNFIKKALESSELVDLDIIINGRKYPLNELNPVKDSDGNFRVTLDLKKLIKTDMASVQIYQNTQYPVLKTVKPVDIGANCTLMSVSKTIDVTPSVKMNLELNVKGRVLNFSM